MDMTLKKYLVLSVVAATFPLGGCASIVSENTYDVLVISNPADASFAITDSKGGRVAEGRTPTIVSLDSYSGLFKWARYEVAYSHADYPDKTVALKARISPFYFLNYPFGFFVGFFIDPFTGAMFDLPKAVNADFVSEPTLERIR